LMSRKNHQLRRAGSKGDERASAGDTPRAQPAPDLGRTPQINHHRTTNLQSRRLEASLPAFCTPATTLPPPPGRAAAER
jgi:hypothetical protein